MNIYALLLDLNMPTTNGFEVLEYLKSKQLIEKITSNMFLNFFHKNF